MESPSPTLTSSTPPGARARVPGWVETWFIPIGLFAGALAIRLPYLMLAPNFTDESEEIIRSLHVSRGVVFPLVNMECYLGALFNYLLGAVFFVFGPSFLAARLTVTVLGALTVPLTYWLGKETEDRPTGVAAALILLTSFTHITNGHIAWESCTTPFFATAAFLLFTLALKRGSGRLLVAAAFLYGLALQTHPTVIPAAPALALYFLYAGFFPRSPDRPRLLRSWLKSPWPYAALLAALLAYGNVIAYNVMHPAAAMASYEEDDSNYVGDRTLSAYLEGLGSWSTLEITMLTSYGSKRTPWADQLTQPWNLFCLALLVVGTASAVRRGKMLPVFLLVSTTLLSPLLNNYHLFPDAARYGAFLSPVLGILVAAPLVRAGRAGGRWFTWDSLCVWVVLLCLVLLPVLPLIDYYRGAGDEGSVNRTVLSIHESLKERYRTGSVSRVLLDEDLGRLRTGPGGRVYGVLDCLLQFDRIPHKDLGTRTSRLRRYLRENPEKSLLLVVYQDHYARMPGAPPAVEISAHAWPDWLKGTIRVLEIKADQPQ